MMKKEHLEVFISYAHEDEPLKKHLEKHLALLRNQGFITVWHDRNISAGTEWAHEINTRLDAAHIILLLISASFLASDYCYSVEMKQAMRRHEAGLARVIPILLRPVDWKGVAFSTLQALPTDTRPVTGRGWRNIDEALADIAQGIRKVVEELGSQDVKELSQRQASSVTEQLTPDSSLPLHSQTSSFSGAQENRGQRIHTDEVASSSFSSRLLLAYKQKLSTDSGMTCEVEEYLGPGKWGELYRASLAGKPVALRWYDPPYLATRKQRSHLEMLITRGAPNEKYLWPIELVSVPNLPGFGYIMPLREERYKSIVDLLRGRITSSFRALATTGFELAQSFFLLHAEGLCYHDISLQHVWFDPQSGEIQLHDTENITVSGSIGGLGTGRFMAPEVVRGEAFPSIYTDLYALAVLLFYLFMFHHPLEGKREADIPVFDIMERLYGLEPVFIFDPNDESNRPVPGYQDNAIIFWPIYPQFLRNRFIRAFTAGLKDPIRGRVREDEWRATFIRLRDSIFYCSSCGVQNFYDDTLQEQQRKHPSCWSCKKDALPPPRLIIRNSAVMLNHDTKLYPHHIDNRRMYNFSSPVAEVTRHPAKSDVWGLKNLSDKLWDYVRADGTSGELAVGKSISLVPGTKLLFGNTVGEIQF